MEKTLNAIVQAAGQRDLPFLLIGGNAVILLGQALAALTAGAGLIPILNSDEFPVTFALGGLFSSRLPTTISPLPL